MQRFAPSPAAEKIPHTSVVLGEVHTDEYHWLRDRDDWRVQAYLATENEYTRRSLAPLAPLVESLRREMAGRLAPSEESVPAAQGEYEYYARQRDDQPHLVHCRRRLAPDAPEEILLDENELARGLSYFSLERLAVSPDHRFLAFGVDRSGDERLALFVKDLVRDETLSLGIEDAGNGLQWSGDGEHLFYTALDEANRPCRLMRCMPAGGQAPEEVYHEADEAYRLHLGKTRSGDYLLLMAGNRDSSEVRVLPAREARGPFRLVEPRQPGVDYSLTHWGDLFVILLREGAGENRVMCAPVESPGRSHWIELIPERPGVSVQLLEAFAGYLVLHEQERGLRRISVFDGATGEIRRLPAPEDCATFHPGDNRVFATTTLRFGYSSLTTPFSVYDCDLGLLRTELRKRTPVPGFDPSLYRSERLLATAPDGTAVPISLVYHRHLRRPEGNPLVLYGYGAYGHPLFPDFDPARLCLLDRGGIFAIAHVRGGGELGKAWHEQGRLGLKTNSINDFISCAEHLIRRGYAAPGRLAAWGESAGGLLVGAVANLRPKLFAAVVADCPFVDPVGTLLDASLPFTPTEWREWGDPRDPEAYRTLRSYSPYDNVGARDYPAFLITGGLNDPRVPYWEPAKWAARLRDRKRGERPVLLRIEGAGHTGPSGRLEALHGLALRYAFLLDQLGLG